MHGERLAARRGAGRRVDAPSALEGTERCLAQGRDPRASHLWQDDYSRPLLEFFTAQLQ